MNNFTKKIENNNYINTNKLYESLSSHYFGTLPVIQWNGPIKLLDNDVSMTHAVTEIIKPNEKYIGFDTETNTTHRQGEYNPTALIQLATSSTCYLFRICCLQNNNNNILNILLPILESKYIIKLGVGIHHDVRNLLKIQNFNYDRNTYIGLNTITRDILHYNNGSLRNLCRIFLHKNLRKKKQKNNWSKNKLNHKEIVYAATDAYVGREIYIQALKHINIINNNV